MHNNNTNSSLQTSSNIAFGKKIYQFKLEDVSTFIQQFYIAEYSDELKLEMHYLIDCLNEWLGDITDLEFETSTVEIYNSVKLINSDKVYATEKFNNQKEYSNITIKEQQEKYDVNEEICFGQVSFII